MRVGSRGVSRNLYTSGAGAKGFAPMVARDAIFLPARTPWPNLTAAGYASINTAGPGTRRLATPEALTARTV
jgi:hypothetical protein